MLGGFLRECDDDLIEELTIVAHEFGDRVYRAGDLGLFQAGTGWLAGGRKDGGHQGGLLIGDTWVPVFRWSTAPILQEIANEFREFRRQLEPGAIGAVEHLGSHLLDALGLLLAEHREHLTDALVEHLRDDLEAAERRIEELERQVDALRVAQADPEVVVRRRWLRSNGAVVAAVLSGLVTGGFTIGATELANRGATNEARVARDAQVSSARVQAGSQLAASIVEQLGQRPGGLPSDPKALIKEVHDLAAALEVCDD